MFKLLNVILFLCSTSLFAGAPVALKTVSPVFPDIKISELNLDTIVVEATVSKTGYVTNVTLKNETNIFVDKPIIDAVSKWKFKPAEKDGKAVASKIEIPFRFNEGVIHTKKQKVKKDKGPKVIAKKTPQRPESLENIKGHVNVKISIDADGNITNTKIDSSSHPELETPVIEALAKWKFKPAIENGIAVASSAMIPFNFNGMHHVAPQDEIPVLEDREVKVIRSSFPHISKDELDKDLYAHIVMTVDKFGYVADAKVIDSNDEKIASKALEVIYDWKFKPAIRDGKATDSKVAQKFVLRGGFIQEQTAEKADKRPVVAKKSLPTVPEELKGVKGYVAVSLKVDKQGNVQKASIKESTQEAFNELTLATVKTWKFKAAMKQGEPIDSTVIVPFIY